MTATGFHLNALGDIAFGIDGKPLDFAETVTYRGMMFTGVPNMAWVFGYFRASWTLRSDLVADFVCRLLNHMKVRQARHVQVALRPQDKDMKLLPWIDTDNFNPGYLMRGMHLLPKRGDKRVWQHTQDYWREKNELPAIDLDDKAFVYGDAYVMARAIGDTPRGGGENFLPIVTFGETRLNRKTRPTDLCSGIMALGTFDQRRAKKSVSGQHQPAAQEETTNDHYHR